MCKQLKEARNKRREKVEVAGLPHISLIAMLMSFQRGNRIEAYGLG